MAQAPACEPSRRCRCLTRRVAYCRFILLRGEAKLLHPQCEFVAASGAVFGALETVYEQNTYMVACKVGTGCGELSVRGCVAVHVRDDFWRLLAGRHAISFPPHPSECTSSAVCVGGRPCMRVCASLAPVHGDVATRRW